MAKKKPVDTLLHQVNDAEKSAAVPVDVTVTISVSAAQLDAYNTLSEATKAKLGPPVYGLVMSAEELKRLAAANGGVGSTIMCPW
ncbi:hypothetical protein EN858_30235 [Mesorhizobium sp. M4B.F.Ca.ET.215.01.1.1]|uniref:hypothetical protein n=1 Tax=unclassified Mesorhizobium TaxID=325217 RepID=UPI000FD1CA94|nr:MULTISPECIES: hypothetical protein [unclassified Mesorhizobium]RUW26831.1 hypothetical protein EOA34_06890 [Mesorhizobium sp. M4B.F.Ca.ET.013.02.1.1]TGQ05069.1 hypothetical protein EN858_30235 [Mesorhizobium sp. M4B.F.Ca.ET.215.01.1.1]TGQ40883.1 hypothetical protein EN863_020830 [Mesorhizobium sp. M00.F.Ca.ET.220.01.1.1]TGQ97514.1 hypothetical protein EN846_29545 [Mesorhizobium sp. M4B.F.Ca.ET.203.01.1.1]TGT45245.1 hypothetical protein EN812_08795 [Mesorhizobium sp. M4B.F.Ca.ET.169.01.1.1]